MREKGIARLSNLSIKRNARDFLVMHFLIRDLSEAIQKYASGSVLDIGCGNKPYKELFGARVTSYTGCDVVQSDRNQVDVICPATALDFPDKTFDVAFTTQVIEHVEDPWKMLAEANRVLKNEGYIIMSAPFSWELHEEPYDFYRFSKYGLKASLEKAGFNVMYVRANGGKWAALVQLQLNIIYSTFKKKGIVPALLKLLFTKLKFTTLFNSIGLWLDNRSFDELLTLNYVVVAQKSAATTGGE